MKKLQRRDFLKLSLTTSIYCLSSANLDADTTNDNYKAIVVIYHAGGNDSLNMFIPASDDAKKGYSNYANIRNNIKVSNKQLTLNLNGNGEVDLTAGNPYGENDSLVDAYTKGFYLHKDKNSNKLDYATNALMPELANLVDKNKIAIIANCGNLIEPATKTDFSKKLKQTPPFLFAHNHQTKLTFNGEASLLDYTGWAGRVYDRWKDINGGDIYGMNISVGRVTHLFDAKSTSPLMINPNGPTKYNRLDEDMYKELLSLNRRDIFKNLYNKLRIHSFDMQNTIVNDWQNNSPDFSNILNGYGDPIFSKPTDEQLEQTSGTSKADISVLNQLSAVAKLIKIGKDRGLKREIFYVFDGGYDTHNNQAQQHSRKLRGLSLALGDFDKAIESLGISNDVLTITCSDFGRSTGNNGDGTDHAWGGSYFVMGGAVKGGIYGTLPDLTLGSDDDYTKKGRLIPTTSMSQYFGTVVKWFGADTITLNEIFPELKNFQTKDLGFIS
jgi:uncharacterized protein (DUF1501 family)